jgi:hypothetical protein
MIIFVLILCFLVLFYMSLDDGGYLAYDCLLTESCVGDIYVRMDGINYPVCGPNINPCQTLSYAITLVTNCLKIDLCLDIIRYYYYLLFLFITTILKKNRTSKRNNYVTISRRHTLCCALFQPWEWHFNVKRVGRCKINNQSH